LGFNTGIIRGRERKREREKEREGEQEGGREKEVEKRQGQGLFYHNRRGHSGLPATI
jgi:hypothetical protein